MMSQATTNATRLSRGCIESVARRCARRVTTEARLEKLGITLPPPNKAPGNFWMANRMGNTMYLSGHLPLKEDGTMAVGKVGENVTTEEATKLAKLIGIHMISTLKDQLRDLDRVRIVKILGFVNCTDGYAKSPAVINGFSDLMVDVFTEERGKHTRSAVGTNALPLNVPVEIEAIVEILDQ
eukprot:266775_1